MLTILTEQGAVRVPMHVEAQGGKAIEAYVAQQGAPQAEAPAELNAGHAPASEQE